MSMLLPEEEAVLPQVKMEDLEAVSQGETELEL